MSTNERALSTSYGYGHTAGSATRSAAVRAGAYVVFGGKLAAFAARGFAAGVKGDKLSKR